MLCKMISEILCKMKMTLKEKMYIGTFIISVSVLRTFSIAYSAMMISGGNLKTERNKAYEFSKRKFSYTEIFRLILSEFPYKKTYIFLLLLIIHG